MRIARRRLARSFSVAVLAALLVTVPVAADHGGAHVELQAGTQGCTGVLPSNEGNTDMRLVGGTLTPGGTAVFEISYPLNASSVGKEFTILDCAFINGEPALKYVVSFVPSNQAFVLRMTLAVPEDAPVGGLYCNYVKTTGSPTAAQASQRKAGPACFVIRAPSTTGSSPQPRPLGSSPGDPAETSTGTTSGPILLPNTALPPPSASR
ncbi:MAG TPA: hypothetical protein VF365_11750 [Candidatus Limnocylindria bacterium]